MTMTELNKFYTIKETAEKTGLDARHIMYRIRRNKLDAQKVGWQWVIPESEVNRLMEENKN